MNVDYLKLWVRSVITEAINEDQLKSVAGSLNIPVEELRDWVMKTDPTSNQGFSVWILRGLKKQWIRMEDAQRITNVLKRFIQLRNAGLIHDIMAFPQISELENRLDQLEGKGAKRQGFSGFNPLTLPGVTQMESDPNFPVTFYKVTNPESAAKMGEGTRWCTRQSFHGGSSIAASYIRRQGALIIGYKDGKPFVQMNPDKSQIMDVDDTYFKFSGFKIHGNKIDIEKPKVPDNYKLTLRGGEPNAVGAYRAWANMTGEKAVIPGMTDETWMEFEKKLAIAIKNITTYGGMLRLMEGWKKLFETVKRRTLYVELAILEKSFKKPFKMRYFGGGGPMKHIPGMYEIVEYAKNIIRGNWPEFEKKIQDDFYNTIYYFSRTGFSPKNITNPLAKETVELMQLIRNKDPQVKTPEFADRFKRYILDAKGKVDRGTVILLRDYLILPYIKLTGKSLKKMLGKDYNSDKFYKWGKTPSNQGHPLYVEPDVLDEPNDNDED